MQITALHGFLGRPQDWSLLFEGTALGHRLSLVDLFQDSILPELWDWARIFNSQQLGQEKSEKQVLMGYSMGGRLALHALAAQPEMWSGAVIISAHPGLCSEEQKELRRQDDALWANRFENEEWDALMRQWSGRAVFGADSFHFERLESDYQRNTLSSCLRKWSLAEQDDLQPQVALLNIPILWIAGECDIGYAAQARRMLFKHPLSKVWIAHQAGHRVPWQLPKLFISELSQFLSQLT